MGAGVEDHDRSIGGIVKRGEESGKVQSVCNTVVIGVCFQSEPHALEYRMVVNCAARGDESLMVRNASMFLRERNTHST